MDLQSLEMMEIVDVWSVVTSSEEEKVLLGVSKESLESRGSKWEQQWWRCSRKFSKTTLGR